jgi:hypothetical protein
MAYNFKNLADVELLNAMPEEANVVVEVNGTTKRAPLPEIPEVDVTAELIGSEALEEVPEGATVLAEVNGEIKRVPSAGLGGGADAWDIIIYRELDDGNFIWEKGDVETLTNMLVTGQPPRICLYYTNKSFSSPNASVLTPIGIELSYPSGFLLQLYFMNGMWLSINEDGSIDVYEDK